MPATSSDAQGWCMLSAKPSSDITLRSASWSRKFLNVDVTSSTFLLSPELHTADDQLLAVGTNYTQTASSLCVILESNAADTRSRNLYQKMVPKTCTKNLTQVHHSFLHQNNSLANHIARFVSCGGQFLWWNRPVVNCVQETSTRKKLVPDLPTNVRVWGTRRLVTVSGISFLNMCRRHNIAHCDTIHPDR